MVDVADQIVLAILTRAPSAGGKTRLFQELDGKLSLFIEATGDGDDLGAGKVTRRLA